MGSSTRTHQVADLIQTGKLIIGDGYRAKNDELAASGVPFARAGNIKDGFNFQDADQFPEADLQRVGNKVSSPGDVVFTSKGTVGRFALVRPDTPQFVYSPQLCFWRSLDLSLIDPRFLFYWMCGREFFLQFKGVSAQTDMAEYVSLSDQRRMSITLPGIEDQRAIAHVLGTLDDKIDLNRRMNETLETVARTIFASWFNARSIPRVPAQKLIDDGVLEVGDGYRAKNSELAEEGLPFIRAGDLNNGFNTHTAERLSRSSVSRAGSKVCRVGDVAFTSKGTIGRFARVGEHTDSFVYSPQVCYWRSLDPSRLHPAVLYCWMQTTDLKSQVLAVSAQTDMAPYVSLQDQRRMNVPVFPPEHLALAERIQPLLIRKSANAAEIRTLTSTRDALLPKLVSAELLSMNKA